MTEVFGSWTVLDKPGRRKWLCRCVCGTERLVVAVDLRNGKSTNCGCIRYVRFREAGRLAKVKHGLEGSSEYRIWTDMRRRCHDPRRPDFKNYGARGVTVCDQWRFGFGSLTGFEVFYRDMGPRPSKAHTLDRVDNAAPYCAQNCRWSTRIQQERNKRTSRVIEVGGETMTVTEAAERHGLPAATVFTRLRLGWSPEEALTKATKPGSRVYRSKIGEPP